MGPWWLGLGAASVGISPCPTVGTVLPFLKQCLSVPQTFAVRNYKVVGRLRLRCRDCFFERRDNRLYVECKTHARHRQAQIMTEPRTPWRFRRKIWKHVRWY
ncbi:unnamed protein product [Hydatigera taeniaeformis]|uniref:Large ribosomal subunit protein bL36m n=1 Tax=Hydatigena taeniaeformis TaxID=6205 RepID=A0A0R3X9D2_HYDTA|nr:unnamed protein product [Hydatigera taeniaeformis]